MSGLRTAAISAPSVHASLCVVLLPQTRASSLLRGLIAGFDATLSTFTHGLPPMAPTMRHLADNSVTAIEIIEQCTNGQVHPQVIDATRQVLNRVHAYITKHIPEAQLRSLHPQYVTAWNRLQTD